MHWRNFWRFWRFGATFARQVRWWHSCFFLGMNLKIGVYPRHDSMTCAIPQNLVRNWSPRQVLKKTFSKFHKVSRFWGYFHDFQWIFHDTSIICHFWGYYMTSNTGLCWPPTVYTSQLDRQSATTWPPGRGLRDWSKNSPESVVWATDSLGKWDNDG